MLSTVPSHRSQDEATQFRWVGFLTILAYFVFLVFYSVREISHPRWAREVLLWPGVIALIVLYLKGWLLVKKGQVTTVPFLFKLITGLSILALLTPPFHSTDMFGYINRGWEFFHYHLNPFAHPIDDIPNWGQDRMIRDHWVNNPSPYGFLFVNVATFLCALGNGNYSATILLFKAANALVHLGIALLVWLGAKQLKLRKPELSLYLYGANPLILMQALANGHNDIMMGLFNILAVYCGMVGMWMWVIPSIVAATLMKYGALFVFPLILLLLIKQKAWKALGLGLLFGLTVGIVASAPYLAELSQIKLKLIFENAALTHNSLHAFIFYLFKEIAKIIPGLKGFRAGFELILKAMLWLGFGGFYLYQLWVSYKSSESPSQLLVRKSLLLQFVLVCIVSSKFYGWYLGMFFPLALLLEEGHWLRRGLVVISLCQLFSLTGLGQAHIANYILMMGIPCLWLLLSRHRYQNKTRAFETTSG